MHGVLKKMGIKQPGETNNCIKEGIRRGFIKLVSPDGVDNVYGLDQVIFYGPCDHCNHHIVASVHDALCQGDVGMDFEDGAPDCKVRCPSGCCGYYVHDACKRWPRMDSGQNYNHCIFCPSFECCVRG